MIYNYLSFRFKVNGSFYPKHVKNACTFSLETLFFKIWIFLNNHQKNMNSFQVMSSLKATLANKSMSFTACTCINGKCKNKIDSNGMCAGKCNQLTFMGPNCDVILTVCERIVTCHMHSECVVLNATTGWKRYDFNLIYHLYEITP